MTTFTYVQFFLLIIFCLPPLPPPPATRLLCPFPCLLFVPVSLPLCHSSALSPKPPSSPILAHSHYCTNHILIPAPSTFPFLHHPNPHSCIFQILIPAPSKSSFLHHPHPRQSSIPAPHHPHPFATPILPSTNLLSPIPTTPLSSSLHHDILSLHHSHPSVLQHPNLIPPKPTSSTPHPCHNPILIPCHVRKFECWIQNDK